MKEKFGGFIENHYLCTRNKKINPVPLPRVGGGRIKQALFG